MHTVVVYQSMLDARNEEPCRLVPLRHGLLHPGDQALDDEFAHKTGDLLDVPRVQAQGIFLDHSGRGLVQCCRRGRPGHAPFVLVALRRELGQRHRDQHGRRARRGGEREAEEVGVQAVLLADRVEERARPAALAVSVRAAAPAGGRARTRPRRGGSPGSGAGRACRRGARARPSRAARTRVRAGRRWPAAGSGPSSTRR
jgi:hypothetical protein